MKKWICFSVVVMMVVTLGACGGKSEQTPPPPATPVTAPQTHAPAAPAASPAPTAAPGAPGTAPAAATVAAPTDPNHQKLIGTRWMVGDFNVTFMDAQTVMVKGGPLAQTAPNGLQAKYSYENGILKVIAMGQAKTGTWDGTKLVVDGKEGVRQSQ
ncbi:MAG TPA: hypothetical protein PLI09_10470 [Candidatus Hydrogenedentes bacterium]|nr:hypothetical protein [Candidatus Hydrogenedentota bacterium]